jgi:four helix bundle protein
MDLAELCYIVTKPFPRDEAFGMTAQIRRSAASVPANIAEGYGRDNAGSYVQFLRIAQGSLKELETHVILACRVGLMRLEEGDGVLSRTEGIGKMLRSLIRALLRPPSVSERLPTADLPTAEI